MYIGHRDDGKGLVRYFSVDNGCVKEIGQWFRGTRDIFKAVIGTMKGKEYIFLNLWNCVIWRRCRGNSNNGGV